MEDSFIDAWLSGDAVATPPEPSGGTGTAGFDFDDLDAQFEALIADEPDKKQVETEVPIAGEQLDVLEEDIDGDEDDSEEVQDLFSDEVSSSSDSDDEQEEAIENEFKAQAVTQDIGGKGGFNDLDDLFESLEISAEQAEALGIPPMPTPAPVPIERVHQPLPPPIDGPRYVSPQRRPIAEIHDEYEMTPMRGLDTGDDNDAEVEFSLDFLIDDLIQSPPEQAVVPTPPEDRKPYIGKVTWQIDGDIDLISGKKSEFILLAENDAQEIVYTGISPKEFFVELEGPIKTSTPKLIEQPDGSFSFTLFPYRPGNYKLVITRPESGKKLFTVPLVASGAQASQGTQKTSVLLKGVGLRGGHIGGKYMFNIIVTYQDGKPLPVAKQYINVVIKNPDKVELEYTVEVDPDNNHIYIVTYEPLVQGIYSVDVQLCGNSVLQRPMWVKFASDTNASQSMLACPILARKVPAKKPFAFKIFAKDKDGYRVGKGGDKFEIMVAGPPTANSFEAPQIYDNSDGTYTVTCELNLPGEDFTFSAMLDGTEIGNSPIVITTNK